MSVAALLGLLFSPDEGQCFAVLDGARSEHVHRATRNLEQPFRYLLEGSGSGRAGIPKMDPVLERHAPRVSELGRGPSPGVERLLEWGFGNSWGYFVRSRVGLWDLRDHLAGLLEAELPDGSVVRFRIFDPRVLRVYLPTCTIAELDQVFGPIEAFLVEAKTPGLLLRYTRGEHGQLELEQVRLTETGATASC